MKRVVIIGGGFAGTRVARALEKNFSVTLIDQKEYFEFTPSILKTITRPKHIAKIQIPHRRYLKNTSVIIGKVTNVSEKEVFLNKKRVRYDYLVIASGSRYSEPFKTRKVVTTDRAKSIHKSFKEIKESKDIIVIGGGLVGVETAAEIIDCFPKKNILLFHSHSDLIERNPEKAGRYAEYFLKKNCVVVHKNEKIVEHNGKGFVSNLGKVYSADLAFLCTGIAPNTSFMRENFSRTLEKGYIKVRKTLQVNGFRNIFAVGDVNNVYIEKTAQTAQHQARIAAKNILSLERGGKLEKYQLWQRPIVLSLGSRKGIFVWKNFVFTGLIPGLMKWMVEKKEIWGRKFSLQIT